MNDRKNYYETSIDSDRVRFRGVRPLSEGQTIKTSPNVRSEVVKFQRSDGICLVVRESCCGSWTNSLMIIAILSR